MLHSLYSFFFFFFKSLLYLIVFLIGSHVPRAMPLVLIGLLYLIILLFMPLLFSEQCWCHVWLPSDVSGCTRKGKSYSSYGQWTVCSLNDQDLYFFVVVMIGLLKKFIKHTVDVFLSSFKKKFYSLLTKECFSATQNQREIICILYIQLLIITLLVVTSFYSCMLLRAVNKLITLSE